VHQHQQPGGDDRCRPAGAESGRARPARAAAHQDFAGARLARGDRLPEKAGLLAPLAELGFALAGYGCTTCIGNAGDLDPAFNKAIAEHHLVVAAVLSGNRNFEARIHPNLRANYLASPPLVVAFAIAGRVNIDLDSEALGPVPTASRSFCATSGRRRTKSTPLLPFALDPETFRRRYADVTADQDLWKAIPRHRRALRLAAIDLHRAPAVLRRPPGQRATSAAHARCCCSATR
jgi:aconitase A